MLTASWFRPATYQVLNGHMGLVASGLDTAASDKEGFYYKKPAMFLTHMKEQEQQKVPFLVSEKNICSTDK